MKINKELSNAIQGLDSLQEKKVYDFLDDLRESGACNMFDAIQDLMIEFNMDKREAKHYLLAWMKTYN